jgi:hypothetical protein
MSCPSAGGGPRAACSAFLILAPSTLSFSAEIMKLEIKMFGIQWQKKVSQTKFYDVLGSRVVLNMSFFGISTAGKGCPSKIVQT